MKVTLSLSETQLYKTSYLSNTSGDEDNLGDPGREKPQAGYGQEAMLPLQTPPEQFTMKLKLPGLGVSAASPHFRAPVSLCLPGMGTMPELPNCCTPAAEATIFIHRATYGHEQ